MTKTIGWAVLILAAVVGSGACSRSVEGFCESWAADTCEVLATCCNDGASFDPDGCRLDLSRECQDSLDLEKVHAGEVEFHSGAASDCFGAIEKCSDVETIAEDESFEHTAACEGMLTGFRPPGAACSKSTECEPAGEFATCWGGAVGDTGVCAAVMLDEEGGCSFSFETNELHICPDGKFCDVFSFEPSSDAPPTERMFEFKASCKPNIGAGGDCIDADGNLLPCAKGLFCDFASSNEPKCAKQRDVGADCLGGNECLPNLACLPSMNAPGLTCQPPKQQKGLYCFVKAECGNGDCEDGEDPGSCPEDCSNGAACGDGFCDDGAGEPAFCPIDCCGDGFCDPGESPICPIDC